ncbi:CDP-glycerol glycerophosphotransferase family protein [Shewanella sp. JM162201]|uniref:CDP-glycerol glycerophosphotransferase family protein n=1 Tax=Shewanella jiangmenensis TaxID=2837387 RepID=A0ABS5V3B1_9GAMM|nr:CDP-glycerol glycerophosphotransferase family protein [Shewanella jiangmenensis]MBT1444929.1 CDP-glycerol glycerophosphotransferase family protein [Shewanella jiangmenensis]
MGFSVVDEVAKGQFEGAVVYSSTSLPSHDGLFLVAISMPEYAQAAIARLVAAGVSETRCLPLGSDSAAIVLEQMLAANKMRALTLLAEPLTGFVDFERRFFAEAYQCLDARRDGSAVIGLYALGRGGGYIEHLGALPQSLPNHYQLNWFTDLLTDKSNEAFFLMSQSAMQRYSDVDLVISAHVFDCSPRQTPKLSFVHMVYDFLLFSEQTYQHLQASDLHYVFVPSQASMKMHQNICRELNLNEQVVLIPGGYPKHDANLRQYKALYENTVPEDLIIYAPTLSSLPAKNECDESYSILEAEVFLKELLATHPQLKLIIRPHPEDMALVQFSLAHPRAEALRRVLHWAAGHPRCEIDDDKRSYLASFSRAKLLITDTASVAFSFALLTGRRPVFFSGNHQTLCERYPDNQFISDRPYFGDCVESAAELKERVELALNNKMNTSAGQAFFQRTLYNLGRSEEYALEAIRYILAGERHPDWWYWQDHRRESE